MIFSRFYILLSFIILHGCLCHAQSPIHGKIVNKKDYHPISDVSVTVLDGQKVLEFTFSDNNGNFRLNKVYDPKINAQISFRCMGFTVLTLPLHQLSQNPNISLVPSDIKLKAVEVTTQRIKQRNDTIIYNVVAMRVKQDKTIADVLKKIPGIEIGKTGQISYMNKPINRFYIEGNDLLGNRYTLASNNISPQDVKDIEILQNHQPIKSLNHKIASDQAAINLKLKGTAKGRIVSFFDLSGGISHKPSDLLYDENIMGYLFAKKMQNLSIYKTNNTGKDYLQESNTVNLISDIHSLYHDPEESSILSEDNPMIPLESQIQRNNQSHYISTNHLWNINKDGSLRLLFDFMKDQNKYEETANTSYFSGDHIVVFDNQEYGHTYNFKYRTNINYEFNSNNKYFKNNLSIDIHNYRSDVSLLSRGQDLSFHKKINRYTMNNDFRYIKAIKDNIFEFKNITAYTSLPERLHINHKDLHQQIYLTSVENTSALKYRHKILGIYVNYEAGLNLKSKMLTSDYDNRLGNEPSTTLRLSNDLKIKNATLYLSPSINIHSDRLDFTAQSPIQLKYFNLTYTKPESHSTSKNMLLWSPSLNMQYKLSGYWTLTTSGKYDNIEPDIHELYIAPILKSPRSISGYSNKLNYLRKLFVYAWLNYNNPLHGFTMRFGSTYDKEYREKTTRIDVDEDFVKFVQIDIPSHRRLVGVNGIVSKLWDWNKTFMKLHLSATQTVDGQIFGLNETSLTSLKVNDINAILSLSMQPSRFINYELSSALYCSQIKNSSVTPSSKIYNYIHQAEINLQLSDNLTITQLFKLIHGDKSIVSTPFFADMRVIYNVKNIEWGLDVNNILNNKVFYRHYYSGASETNQINQLRCRQILLRMAFRL